MCIVFHFISLSCNLGILNLPQSGQVWQLAFSKHVKPKVSHLCPIADQWSKQILVLRCLKEKVCRSSHGDAAVELVDLPLEELLQLWSLGLQCRSQEAVFNGEHIVVDVDVLHLEKENGKDVE